MVCPAFVEPIESLQVFLATQRLRRAEVKQHRLSAERSQAASLAGRILQRKGWRRNGHEQPGLNHGRHRLGIVRGKLRRKLSEFLERRLLLEGFRTEERRIFLNPDSAAGLEIVEF